MRVEILGSGFLSKGYFGRVLVKPFVHGLSHANEGSHRDIHYHLKVSNRDGRSFRDRENSILGGKCGAY